MLVAVRGTWPSFQDSVAWQQLIKKGRSKVFYAFLCTNLKKITEILEELLKVN